MKNNVHSLAFALLAASAAASFGGLREDFARSVPAPGTSWTAQSAFEARCAKVLPGGTSAFKRYAGPDSLKGVSLAGLSPVDARSLCVAQGENGGMRVYGFRDAGRRFARELVVVPGVGLDAASAEIWDPAQGVVERPFAENGRIYLSLSPEETLFLVWPERRSASLPPRVNDPVGPETQLRTAMRETPPVDGGAALEGASWIWHPATRLAKGFATLRTSFDIPANAKVDGAKLTFSCDNGVVVKINGREVARQGNGSEAWRRLSVKDVRSALKPGRNTVEALCENTVDGDAGLLASIDIAAGGKSIRVFTDPKTWEASLDGKSFTAAWGERRYGAEPWLRFDERGFAAQRPLARKRELEITFDLGTVKPNGRLFLVRDDPCSGTRGGTAASPVALSVNGTFAGGFVGRQRRLDVTRFVRAGANAIRVESTFFQNPRLVWTAPATGPYGLACEYQREPLGVVKPRFFWKYAGGKPDRFTFEVRDRAGRIVAAQDTDTHLYFEPDMKLEPFTRYLWRVEGGGGAGEGTFVTGAGKWRMPFFRPGWKHDLEVYWVARKKVELRGAKSAILSVVTLGSHRLYVNGRPASDGIAPNRSHVEDGILLATTYDVTPLVKDGANEIDIYVSDGWAGAGLSREKVSCLSVDGRAETEDGVVAIDSSKPWTVAKSADRAYGKVGLYSNLGRAIERLCDREELTDEQPGVPREGPPFTVTFDVSDRDWAQREIRPVSIVADGNGWKVDMGEQFTGFVRLKLKGAKGTTARMTASDTFVDRCNFNQKAELKFRGGGGVFQSRLNWLSARFLYFTGCEKPGFDDVAGIVMSSVGRRTGGFCGDHDMETIQRLDNNTMIATTQLGVTVDCPHRERLGYGEASLSAMWGNMPCFDSAAYFYAYILKWASSQRPDGSIPHVSPDGFGGGGTFWSNFPVYALWEYTRLYPDARLCGIVLPVADKWLDYLHSHVKNGVLQQYEPDFGYRLGDWLYPEVHLLKNADGDWEHTTEGKFFNNCSYAWAIVRALEIPGLVVDAARRAELKRRHAELVANIDRTWYRDGLYVSEDGRYQAIALVCGAAEAGGHFAETENALLDIIERKGYVDGGSPSYTVILRALCASRRGRELVLRTFRRHESPGFLFFADEGYSTIPEDWWYGRSSRGSMIHTCYTGPAGALFRGFAGFKMAGSEITVAPFLSDALPNFSAHVETLYGTLALKVETRGGRRVVWVDFPEGCKGRFVADGARALRPGRNRFEIPSRR